MKRILVPACLVLPLLGASQTTPSQTTSEHTAQARSSQEIDQDLKKADKLVSRTETSINKRQQENRDLQREIELNEKHQQANVERAAEVKNTMGGYDLEPLEDKIDRLEKDQRTLNNRNEQNEAAIIRKKARIEKLQSEIELMESQIDNNQQKMNELDAETVATQEVITSYGLVEKDAELNDLQKDLKSLKKKNEKMHQEVQKNQDELNAETHSLFQYRAQVQQLKKEASSLNTSASSQQ
ncbi:MAG: hypothetical protein KDC12_10315 [Flavobacteriales bacterium]|nr:hypothetical protein [Flavobacteriales bacterium]